MLKFLCALNYEFNHFLYFRKMIHLINTRCKRNTRLILLIAFTLLACNQNITSKRQENPTKEKTAYQVGNDSDSHGCKASVGERWSFLMHKCVRLFENATRLIAVDYKKKSAFILFNDNLSKAELFLPEMKEEQIILIKGKDGVFSDKNYKYDKKKGILFIEGKQEYVRKMVQFH